MKTAGPSFLLGVFLALAWMPSAEAQTLSSFTATY